MKILVCVKQVPAKTVPMDKTSGVLDRSQAGGRINPWDLYAIEVALKIREAAGGTVTAFSMGPESAVQTLKTALSMGADDAILLTDKAFAGADVYATAFAISQGIKASGKYDVVVCGQQTTDGDTAQLPFSLAVRLGIPAIGWIKKFDSACEGKVSVVQELSFGIQKSEVNTPCLLAIGDGVGTPRIPSLRDQLKAKSKTIKKVTLENLEEKDSSKYGLNASPTRVVKVREVEQSRKCESIECSAEESAELILSELNKAKGGKA